MKTSGFSFVEILVTVTIIAFMMAAGYAALNSGESSWFTSEASIQVQENLRKALDQMTAELRQTQFSRVTLSNGTGVDGTDIITFSIPVICHTGDNLLNSAGDVAHWGATLRWGCRDAACMDANDDCSSVEYKSIRYLKVAGHLLVRQVLDNADISVRQDTIAHNITDFQMTLPGATSPLTITLTGQLESVMNRPIAVTVQSHVDFRN